jgi:hypothetical protein
MDGPVGGTSWRSDRLLAAGRQPRVGPGRSAGLLDEPSEPGRCRVLRPQKVAAQDSPSCARHPAGMSVQGRPLVFSRRRHRPDDDDPLSFAGERKPSPESGIWRELGVEVGASEIARFLEGTLFVRA